MIYEGFIGPAYRSRSVAASGDQLQNLFAEPIETGKGASPMALYGTPGISAPLVTLDDTPVRGFATLNGRTWVVGGSTLYELINNGNGFRKLAVMAGVAGTTPTQLITDGKTVVIAASGKAFTYVIDTAVLSPIDPGALAGASSLAIMDGFFLASVPNTRQFQRSALNDGTSWAASDFNNKNGCPDNLQGLVVNRRLLWLMGNETGEIWWLSGNVNNPFERVQGLFLETGLAATATLTQLDQELFWLGKSRRGQASFYRASGFQPKRVSTFALEYLMSAQVKDGGYARIDDAVAFPYEEGGHSFLVVSFPSAFINAATGVKTSATWVLDLATNWWHQRTWIDPDIGDPEGVRGWVHTFNFGMHLVGDRENGNIYQQAIGIYTDNGRPIKRLRRAPVLTFELKQTFFHRLDLHIQQGVVPQGPAQGSLPLFALRSSRDGGFTWTAEIEVAGGTVGQYDARMFWGPLGAGRRQVYEISSSEPIEHVWIGAYLEATPGNQ